MLCIVEEISIREITKEEIKELENSNGEVNVFHDKDEDVYFVYNKAGQILNYYDAELSKNSNTASNQDEYAFNDYPIKDEEDEDMSVV